MPAMNASPCGNALCLPCWRKNGGKSGSAHKEGQGYGAVNPCPSECWRQDLNLHTLHGYQALNLARLPIPPLQLDTVTIDRAAAPCKGFTPFFARRRRRYLLIDSASPAAVRARQGFFYSIFAFVFSAGS